MYFETLKLRIYPAAIVLTSLFSAVVSPVYAAEAPQKQKFVVTAYYSPLPNQCCYYRGGYEEEIIFNGQGIKGADGTGVYPGMIAAPPAYPFGTVIELPSIGVVGTVHDRGGRIIEWDGGVHRIDLWMGYGEEGLARALSWGARSVEGVVHAKGSAPKEHFELADFDADRSMIASLSVPIQSDLLPEVEAGYTSNAVRKLQEALATLGYFTEKTNAHYGPATQDALRNFQMDYGIVGDGTALTKEVSAILLAAQSLKPENVPTLEEGLRTGSEGDNVRQAQKLLRYLDAYRGRTDGTFDESLRTSVLSFQLSTRVIGNEQTTGAGTIGPKTRDAILKAWKVKVVRQKAEILLRKEEVRQKALVEALPTKTLSKGDKGTEVKKLQTFLVSAGYLPQIDATGNFGPRTEAALLKYQLDTNIIATKTQKGAGIFGPATLSAFSEKVIAMEWQKVRSGS